MVFSKMRMYCISRKLYRFKYANSTIFNTSLPKKDHNFMNIFAYYAKLMG